MQRWRTAFLVGAMGMAAWGDTGAPLTWDDCVRQAALRNPDLLSAIRAMEAGRAQYYGSFNGILPQLNLTNSYTDSSASHTTLLSDGTSATSTAEFKSWQAQGTVSLDVIDFNQWATIRAQSALSRQTQASAAVASSNVLLNLYKSFSALLYAQEEIGVATSIRDLWNTNAQMISLRYDSGRESKGNAMQTDAQRLQADMALKQAGRDVEVAKRQMAQVMGQDDFSAIVVTGTFTASQAPQSAPDFEALLDQLPTIRVQQAVVDQAKAAVSAAHSTLFPALSLNYSRGYTDSTEFPTSNPYWTFTGLVSYPLFGGGPTATYYASVAAQRTYEKTQQDMRSLRDQTRTTLESAWSAFAQAEDQIQVQQAFLNSAIQRKQESDTLYQAGLMTYQDWELIMSDYVNFQKSFLSAEQNLISAEGQWRFATGQQLGATR